MMAIDGSVIADGQDGDDDFNLPLELQHPLPAPQPPATLFFSLGNPLFILLNSSVGTLYFGWYRILL